MLAVWTGPRATLTGVGVAGIFVYLPMSGAEYFGETIGVPIVLLLSGLLLIVVMLYLLRRGAGPRLTGSH